MAKRRETAARWYRVHETALPEVHRKVLAVKAALAKQEGLSVNKACQAGDLSRSAFYKYRDLVQVDETALDGRLFSVAVRMESDGQELGRLLSALAKARVEVLHVSQSPKDKGQINSFLALRLSDRKMGQHDLATLIKRVRGVRAVRRLSSSEDKAKGL